MNRVGNTHSCTVFFISQTSFKNVVIPLTHHKNGGFTELKVAGVWALNYPFVYSIFSRCAKGIVIFKNNIEVYADGEMNTIITAIQDKYINGILALKDGSDWYIFGHFIDTSLSYCITDNEILSLNVR